MVDHFTPIKFSINESVFIKDPDSSEIGKKIIEHGISEKDILDRLTPETLKSGEWKNKNLIAQPSFNLVTEGSDVMKEEVLSPFLKGNLRNFDVIVVGDRLYEFGKVGEL